MLVQLKKNVDLLCHLCPFLESLNDQSVFDLFVSALFQCPHGPFNESIPPHDVSRVLKNSSSAECIKYRDPPTEEPPQLYCSGILITNSAQLTSMYVFSKSSESSPPGIIFVKVHRP